MHLTPATLKSLCKQCGLTPSKKYGQNFLISEWPIEKMLKAADLTSDDTVVEIGPGFGVLTFALAGKAGRVIGLEIERKLEDYWKKILERKKINDKMINDIQIIWGNALKQLSSISCHLPSYKVIANLPYQITSHVLRVLLELENKPEVIVVMVQKEVAEKICAVKGDMSLLSVSVQYYGEPKIIAKVSRGNFWPEPAVDSAILKIKIQPHPFPPLAGESRGWFFSVVRAGFANKRKQLWKNLSRGFKIEDSRLKNIIKKVVGNEKARAEELGVEEWMEVSKQMTNTK